MNARMLELAVQAGLKKDHASEYVGDFDWRTFGNLIVEECLSLLKESQEHYANPIKCEPAEDHEEYYITMSAKEYAIADAISDIKYRFEVEE